MENHTAPAPAAQKVIPFRSVGEEEWARVPRSIPDLWLSAGAWIPLGALLLYLIRFAPQPLVFGSWWPILLTYSFFCGVIVLLRGAGRHAAWVGLAAAFWFNALLDPSGAEQQVLFGAMGYFGLLAAAGLIGQLRFAALLNSWHRAAQGSVQVPTEALKPLAYIRMLPPWMWKLTGTIVAWPLLKGAWKFFTSANMDLAALEPKLYHELGVGLAVLALVLLLSALKWLESRSVPMLALEIPVLPQAGPLGFTGVGCALPASQEQPAACICADHDGNADPAEFKHPGWLLVSEHCAVHGIRAVNELNAEQFLAISRQPWVYGPNAAGLRSAGTERMVIAGLHGWGAKPVRLGTTGIFGGGSRAGEHLVPAAAREPLRRAARAIRWEDPNGNELAPETDVAAMERVIDRISLASLGIDSTAVRVAGHRVRLQAHAARLQA